MPKIMKANKELTSQSVIANALIIEKQIQESENARKVWETYSNTKNYVPGNKVEYNGSSYVCLQNSTGKIPVNFPTYWQLIAAAGTGLTDARQLPIVDTGNYYTIDDTNSALQEVGQRLNLKQNTSNIIHTDTVNDTSKYPSSAVTYAHGQAITTLNESLTTNQLPVVQGLLSQELIDNYYNTISNGMNDSTFYRRSVYHGYGHSILGGGVFILDGFKSDSLYETQKIRCYSGDNSAREYTRSKYNGSWMSWVNPSERKLFSVIPASGIKIDMSACFTMNGVAYITLQFSKSDGTDFTTGIKALATTPQAIVPSVTPLSTYGMDSVGNHLEVVSGNLQAWNKTIYANPKVATKYIYVSGYFLYY
jgi:hypothetical protein